MTKMVLKEVQKQKAYELFNKKHKARKPVKKPENPKYAGWYECFLNVKRAGATKLYYSYR